MALRVCSLSIHSIYKRVVWLVWLARYLEMLNEMNVNQFRRLVWLAGISPPALGRTLRSTHLTPITYARAVGIH